ncbi:hypothetical protein A2Z63_00965 [Candidatus Giovannonibacteria bacterium RIFCSPLOWO2_02_44_8]|uniref:Conjugal transfer protein TrbC n=2 Tax=Candidatus Giovannoniibacteriota TaxID=1752738 RepID=A0A1F5XCN1_9BACT|nr:MAG: hypothetical protein A2W57_01995 [Candidatus Giovannonibacteria bacterium RIFCSPHIGHO2_02_43_16]OGF85692.1 MAG: hypothetical protein A2Z63_00965 [Candidatus Giovannonibacteria bacterium RIFCSPLOWO2_02_44_8]
MTQIKKVLPYIAISLAPSLVLAAQIDTIVASTKTLVNNIIPILLIIGTIVFLWGVIMFLTAGADEEKRANARSLMIYGLVGLFVMVAAWGIVNVLVGFTSTGGVGIPTSPGGIPGI